jgi:hypothetical protein
MMPLLIYRPKPLPPPPWSLLGSNCTIWSNNRF